MDFLISSAINIGLPALQATAGLVEKAPKAFWTGTKIAVALASASAGTAIGAGATFIALSSNDKKSTSDLENKTITKTTLVEEKQLIDTLNKTGDVRDVRFTELEREVNSAVADRDEVLRSLNKVKEENRELRLAIANAANKGH